MFKPLKERLKAITWISALNAGNKSRHLKKTYANTVAYYAGRPEGVFDNLLISRLGDRRKKLDSTRALSLFCLGTDGLQDRSGILQALGRMGELRWFTRADGCYGQNHPGPVRQRRETNSLRLLDLFSTFATENRVPDILVAQTWGSFIDPDAMGAIRSRYGTIVINIAMDDRHQYWGEKTDGRWGGTYSLIPHIDLALTAAPECVEWYQKEGCPALFFPEASDPEIYHPMPELPKVHDVSFVGGRYGIREKIVSGLRKAGIRVSAYGQGWEGGRLAVESAPRLFAQSKIVLGVGTIGHCKDFYALKMRDFDGPMSGSLYLTHDNPDLQMVYDVGREIAVYRDSDECVERVRYYLEQDKEREAVARRGRERALREHTWERRFTDLLAQLRGN